MNQKSSNRRSAAEWHNLIGQQQESGVSKKAFCEFNNTCLSMFSLWKCKLTQPDVTPSQLSNADTDSAVSNKHFLWNIGCALLFQ